MHDNKQGGKKASDRSKKTGCTSLRLPIGAADICGIRVRQLSAAETTGKIEISQCKKNSHVQSDL